MPVDHYTRFLKNSSDLFTVFKVNGSIVEANEKFCITLGYQPQDIKQLNIRRLMHPADLARNSEALQKIVTDNEVLDFETRIRAKNGRYFTLTYSAYFEKEAELIYALGVSQELAQVKDEAEDVAQKIQHVLQAFNEGFLLLDPSWTITLFNPAFLAISGLVMDNLLYQNVKDLFTSADHEELISAIERSFTDRQALRIQYHDARHKHWLRVNILPYGDEIMLFFRNITNVKIPQLILALEKKVLEMNVLASYSLSRTFDVLVEGIEAIFPEMYCSILEVDDAQERVHHLSAPRLPSAYIDAINGQKTGPQTGSCGTAAYHRKRIVVTDIDTDPLWKNYKQYVAPYGFKASWSTPVISSHGIKVLATFAIYYKDNREPDADEVVIVDRTVNILRVLIEGKKNADHVNQQNQKLQEIASVSSHELRRPVATILGLVSLFDRDNADSALNKDIIDHLNSTARELDDVIHTIVKKTVSL